jgi:hypothetical protein
LYSISVVAPVGKIPTNDAAAVFMLIVKSFPVVSEAYIVELQSTGVGVAVGVLVGVAVGVGVGPVTIKLPLVMVAAGLPALNLKPG